jgi:hypothetical protein
MSSEEFSLHQALMLREPGGEGDMHRWAAMMAAIANGALRKRDKSLFRAKDFYPDPWEPEPAPPPRAPDAKPPMQAPDFSHLRGMRVRSPR